MHACMQSKIVLDIDVNYYEELYATPSGGAHKSTCMGSMNFFTCNDEILSLRPAIFCTSHKKLETH